MTEDKKEELTYEMVMKMFAETDKRIEKMFAETSEQAKESKKDLDARFKETERLIKANAKQIGGIDRSNGLMAEEAVYNALKKDNTFANIKFDYIRKNIQLQSEDHRTLSELDIMMVNGDTISIIETKYKVEKKDIKKMLTDKLPHLREVFPKYNNHKVVLGVGGMGFEDNAEEYAKENGIGIIKIIGDKVEFYTEGIKMY